MKNRLFSLLAAFLLAVLVLTALLSGQTASAAEISADTFYYDQLNERQKELYIFLKNYYDGLSDKPGVYEINLTHLLPANPTAEDYRSLQDDCFYASIAVAEDYPLYNQKSFIRGSGSADPGDTPFFVLDIIRTNLVTADVQKRVDARIKQLVSIAGTGDRYTQLRRLTHYLIENSFYDPYLDYLNGEGHHDYALATRGHFYNQSVYGLLLEGIAVCDGFSQTFKLLCSELNIPCIIMGNAGHAWNLVQMEDGKWYRVDLTNACRVGWEAELPQTIDAYFNEIFLNNNTLMAAFGAYDDPYMLSLNNVALVTEFPEHADGQYQYTGGTTDFSYTVAASTYTPGSGKFSYRVNGDGKTCTITNYEGKESGDLTIPGKLDGYTVTAIDGYAFYYCTGFTGKVTIPDSVESIGKGAFAGCYNLTSVEMPDGLQKLGQGVFVGCKKLTAVVLPDLVSEVGDYAFYDCVNFASVTFGSHIQTMGIGVFDNIKSGAVIKAPAGSVAQQRASEAGITFQASGSLCPMQDADGKWEFEGNRHYHICQHGARFDEAQHIGMYCGWKCADCGAEYCGIKDVYRESVITLVNAKPATCNSPEYTGDKVCV